MRKEKILLTPELARSFRECCDPRNRTLRAAKVSEYKTDILEHRWNEDISEVDGAFVFSEDGYLMNGNHRCAAVIEANTPIHVWVYYDVPKEMFAYFDIGAPRTAAEIANVKNAVSAASIAKVLFALKYGKAPLASALGGQYKTGRPAVMVTKQQVLQTLREENDVIQRYIILGNQARKYLGRNQNNISIALCLIDYVGRGNCLDRFIDECSKIAPTVQCIVACRSYMGSCLANRNFKITRRWIISCILATYESFIENKEIRSFNKLDSYISRYDKYLFEARKGENV